MKIKVRRVIERVITRCLYDCPYFTEGEHIMSCGHRKSKKNPYILDYVTCSEGFPKQCPLIKRRLKNE
jgi:hypothetical protein